MSVKKSRGICLACGKNLKRHTDKYCDNACQRVNQYNVYITRWLSGLENGMKGSTSVSFHIRRWLFENNNNSCQLCRWSKINPSTGIVPLEIHHIDGNHRNNCKNNLQLLCPNCHSLTPNNKGLNRGNGRK